MTNNFEEDLKRLEELSSEIKQSDISLETALKDFEEGIKLAKKMEKQLEGIEAKIQILMKEPAEENNGSENSKSKKGKDSHIGPSVELFDGTTEVKGTRNV